MHVLITNDDGPLNDDLSQYIRNFVQTIRKSKPDWKITVCVPHIHRSWSGKAHLAGKNLTAQFLYSKLDATDNSFLGPFTKPQLPNDDSKLPHVINNDIPKDAIEWILIDGTPASCANIALYHLRHTKFDLVLSGPNVGRNTSAAYSTSSATIGAAMESVISGRTKAIAISWAYFDGFKTPSEEIMKIASKRSIDVSQHLYDNWNSETDLYSINIPIFKELSMETRVFYAPIWENRWNPMFDGAVIKEPDALTEIEDANQSYSITFNWNPDFKKHRNSKHYKVNNDFDPTDYVKHIAPGTDSYYIEKKQITVTPLRAIFRYIDHLVGELQLDDNNNDYEGLVAITIPENDYIFNPIKSSVKKYLPNYKIVNELPKSDSTKIFQYGDYEQLDVDRLVNNNGNYFANSYIYRKALIRKHYLLNTIENYVAKNPSSILKKAYMESYNLDLDYAEFLDDSLDESWELKQELEKEEKWWIIKPSMSDKGQGIRVFKTIDDLQAIFDSFDDDDDDQDSVEETDQSGQFIDDNKINISQLRHFIVQEYLSNPLLLPSMNNKKFHIRCYITCKGDLEVFVYNRMLALFAPTPFEKLDEIEYDVTNLNNLQCHLTNTCLQAKNENKGLSVKEFDNIEDISEENKENIKKQIHEISHEIFKAAVTVNRMNFQPLPNAFETYGVDFLIDDEFNVKLLEINAYPDFKQTGDELKGLIDELFDSTVKYVVKPLLEGEKTIQESENYVKVLNHTSNQW
ncbi:hypothetical protein KAFR_0G01640 [Kazachstania africana CBS 2517]|uniref:ATP-grasp domain-containing protein n=1 Tax=Kazachstania africana (strain ATCC 22294 / BCRC 22015 / CBS 2517 / CECT 1963 / NBRC 1671 / NRRL Y-8276) TaxID=1071382 RepID=H2AXU8_KAZAF|nr:hypothetical protein KAFR_0G01640 [Kazachstania africana CBS 2517]CCF59198.1 hypothetical protein KAFR_0G01640 [Kazachstania africana CBS 2517]